MSFVKVYRDIATGTTNANGVSGARVIAGATTANVVFSHGVPIRGARYVAFRILVTQGLTEGNSRSAYTPSAWAINVGNNNLRIGSTTWSSSSGAGYSSALGNIGLRCDNLGNTVAVGVGSNLSGFFHDFAQLSLSGTTTAGNDLPIARIDAEVWYGVDAEAFLKTVGQADYIFPAT